MLRPLNIQLINGVNLFSIGLLLFIISCQLSCSRPLSKEEYVKALEDVNNGHHVTKVLDECTIDIQYLPLQFQAIKFSDFPESHTASDSLDYYLIRITLDNEKDIASLKSGSQIDQQRAQYYFSYLFQNDIYSITNGKKSPCVIYQYEKSFGVKPYSTFLVAFRSDYQSESSLVLESIYIDSLPIKFTINKQVPEVSI